MAAFMLIIGIALIVVSAILLLITPVGIVGLILGIALIVVSRKTKKNLAKDQVLREEHRQYVKDHYVTIDIAGLYYHQEELSAITDEDNAYDGPCQLIQEPDNEYDPNAIKVVIKGILAGYIPKDRNVEINKRFSDLLEADATIDLDGDISGYVTMKFK